MTDSRPTSDSEVRIIRTIGRNNCGGRCIIKCHVQDGQIRKITTDTPEEAGHHVPRIACARGLNYHKTFINEDRLLYPMKRIGARGEGRFQRISWEEAIDIITEQWIRIRDTYGPASRYVLYGTGEAGALSGGSFAKRLLRLDGGHLGYYNSYSTACVRAITPYVYGTSRTGNTPDDWLNSSLIVLWGHNPAETVFDSETMFYLRKCREKGIPMIGIDPRRNTTFRQLDADWYPIRPTTDAALADAIAWELVSTGRYDREFIRKCCIGFEKSSMPEGVPPEECVFSYLSGEQDGIPKTAEWGESITGLPAERIRELASRMWEAKPMNILQGYGPQRGGYGEQATRAAILLTCLTGNVGIPGGSACGIGDWQQHVTLEVPSLPNPVTASIPTLLWTEAVDRGTELTPLDGLKGAEALDTNIKMIFAIASNMLINQHSDINHTRELLQDPGKVEFIVVSDLFLTASARYADILLPGTSFLEEENILNPWSNANMLGYANRVIEPLGECRPEYEWLKEIAERLGCRDAFTEGHEHPVDWLRHIYEDARPLEPELPDFDTFRERGIHRFENNRTIVAFQQECTDPEHFPFPTPSGKIEIFSRALYEMEFREPFPPIPRYMPSPEGAEDPCADRFPLQLTGWHSRRRTHSIHENNPSMEKLTRRAIQMNPLDAAARDLTDGQPVRVWNDRGQIRIPVHITEDIMPGVTAIPQGAWFTPDSDGVDTAGSLNVLTGLNPTPMARGNTQHTIRVQVAAEEIVH